MLQRSLTDRHFCASCETTCEIKRFRTATGLVIQKSVNTNGSYWSRRTDALSQIMHATRERQTLMTCLSSNSLMSLSCSRAHDGILHPRAGLSREASPVFATMTTVPAVCGAEAFLAYTGGEAVVKEYCALKSLKVSSPHHRRLQTSNA